MSTALTAWIDDHPEATITLDQHPPYATTSVTVTLIDDGRSCERSIDSLVLHGDPLRARALLDELLAAATRQSDDATTDRDRL